MASGKWFGRVVVLVFFSAMWAGTVQAQGYGYPGMGVPGRTWVPSTPYPYPQAQPVQYPYGDEYSPESSYGFFVPPPLRFLAPSFSYNANPYAPFPRSFSYELPQNAYAPNSYTYDLRAYGYGYPPSAYAPPIYLPPSYPYGYSYPYAVPRYQRGIYRQLSLRQYIDRQLHGPVRVRDVVLGRPELGGQAAAPGR